MRQLYVNILDNMEYATNKVQYINKRFSKKKAGLLIKGKDFRKDLFYMSNLSYLRKLEDKGIMGEFYNTKEPYTIVAKEDDIVKVYNDKNKDSEVLTPEKLYKQTLQTKRYYKKMKISEADKQLNKERMELMNQYKQLSSNMSVFKNYLAKGGAIAALSALAFFGLKAHAQSSFDLIASNRNIPSTTISLGTDEQDSEVLESDKLELIDVNSNVISTEQKTLKDFKITKELRKELTDVQGKFPNSENRAIDNDERLENAMKYAKNIDKNCEMLITSGIIKEIKDKSTMEAIAITLSMLETGGGEESQIKISEDDAGGIFQNRHDQVIGEVYRINQLGKEKDKNDKPISIDTKENTVVPFINKITGKNYNSFEEQLPDFSCAITYAVDMFNAQMNCAENVIKNDSKKEIVSEFYSTFPQYKYNEEMLKIYLAFTLYNGGFDESQYGPHNEEYRKNGFICFDTILRGLNEQNINESEDTEVAVNDCTITSSIDNFLEGKADNIIVNEIFNNQLDEPSANLEELEKQQSAELEG